MDLLNNKERKDKIKLAIQNYVMENDNEMVEPTMVLDALKAVMRGRFISESTSKKRRVEGEGEFRNVLNKLRIGKRLPEFG